MGHDRLGPGTRLDRYELLMELARGGMATVWVARLTGTRGFQKLVAVKTMLPDLRLDADAERFFLSEASLASRIRHPNVVEIMDLGEQDGVLFQVMELVHGIPLSALLSAARGPLPLPVAVKIGAQVAAGLHAAHELRDDAGEPLGLVHRDVSPHNVLVGFNGVVKVTDFGVAKTTAEALDESPMLRGKVPYMSPEQVRCEDVDRRTDVFAMGVLLYLTTTGRHPFRQPDETETFRAICSASPVVLPSRFIDRYPRKLEQVLQTALSKDRELRYASAAELERALATALPPQRERDDQLIASYVAQALPDRVREHDEQMRRLVEQTQEIAAPPPSSGGGQSTSTLKGVSSEAALELLAPRSPAAPPSDSGTPAPGKKRRQGLAILVAAAASAVLGAIAVTALSAADAPSERVRATLAQPPAPEANPAKTEAEATPPSSSIAATTPGAASDSASSSGSASPAPSASATASAAPAAAVRPHVVRAPVRKAVDLKDPYAE